MFSCEELKDQDQSSRSDSPAADSTSEVQNEKEDQQDQQDQQDQENQEDQEDQEDQDDQKNRDLGIFQQDHEFYMRKGNRIKAVATSADYRFYGYLCGGKLHSDPTAFALSTYVSHKNSGNDVAPMESFEPVTFEGKDYVFLAGLFTLDHTNGKETTYGLCVTQEDMLKLLKMEQIPSTDLKMYADDYIGIIMIPLCRILTPKKEEYERQATGPIH